MTKRDHKAARANDFYRELPGINELLEREHISQHFGVHTRERVTQVLREILSRIRAQLQAGQFNEADLTEALAAIPASLHFELNHRSRPRLRRVLNATGVILQTNLGRAPLSESAISRIAEVAGDYCNLEFDLQAGKRSRRDVHAEDLLLELLQLRSPQADFSGTAPSRAVAIVNNCAAATFLALNTFAEGGEVIVSRGELVEIGGGFRIPEILAKSGAVLREVGTTNKTRVSDYASAIGPATRLMLKVHRSNFRIEGFTEQPSLQQLVALGRETSVPVFEDQGTGCVLDLEQLGLRGESSWLHSVCSGAQLVAASGDKLLGGPQCGLLVGDRDVVERLRSNPLFRALRADKLTYAALEATLTAYLTGMEESLPVARMLRIPAEQIRVRCERLASAVNGENLSADLTPAQSVVGGGTTPGASLPSFAVSLHHNDHTEEALAALLRKLDPPVVGRVCEGHVLLDLRTISPQDDDLLASMLRSLRSSSEAAIGD